MEDIVYNLLNWQSADLTILACAGIIYQLFSRVSPLPRILHNLTKTTIHHGTLKYNMEPTTYIVYTPLTSQFYSHSLLSSPQPDREWS